MAPSVKPGAASFWEFVRLRQEAWSNRAAGRPAPYSDDPAIARYHFTNVYRELDRGTRWFHTHVPGRGLYATLVASMVYRPINRMATFEAFGGNIPMLRQFDKFYLFLVDRMNGGERVFTGRHQTRGLVRLRRTLGEIAEKSAPVADAIRRADTTEQVLRLVKTVYGMGDFFAWQVVCDLNEAGVLDQADRDGWAHLGPGAMAGLRLVFPHEGGDCDAQEARSEVGAGVCRKTSVAYAQILTADPRNELPRRHVPGELPNRLSIKNVEHALCEYTRWVACRNGGSHGLEVKSWAR